MNKFECLNVKRFFNKNLDRSKRYTAFTLAEVLITLVIIGVIAALTIPNLINNYQKTQTEAQLKKSYSVLSQFFKELMAYSGCNDLMCTGLFDLTIPNSDWQDNMDATARKYLKVLKSCKNGDTTCQETVKRLKETGTITYFTSTSNINFILSDGTKIELFNLGCAPTTYPEVSKIKNSCAGIIVDLNSSKPPNTLGKDVFSFGTATQNGDLFPDTSIEWAKAGFGTNWEGHTWRDIPGQCGEPEKTLSETSSNVGGQNCLARIIENSWKIDYY